MQRPLFSLLFASFALATTAYALDQKDLLPPDQAFKASMEQVDPTHINVNFQVAPGYYLYHDRIKVSAAPGTLFDSVFPAGKIKNDPNFGKMEVYPHSFNLQLASKTAWPAGTTLTVKMQGCADAGVCYPPQTVTLKASTDNASHAAPASTSKTEQVFGTTPAKK